MHAQAGKLKYYFPDSSFRVTGYDKRLVWDGKLRPSDLSPYYDIRIEYSLGKHPNIYVINPKPLVLADGQRKLPHVYDHDNQHLCLYFKPGNEWTPNKMISDTIIPWTSEWLLHYEYWALTGEWRGGGIEHK